MGSYGVGRFVGIALVLVACVTVHVPAAAAVSEGGTSRFANASEVYQELHVQSDSAANVRRYLLTFRDYQDLVLYDPTFGYYAKGRVDFRDDYRTFPTALAPYFGRMVAEQVLRMWDGMRHAGTLAAGDPFVVAEFGAGNGALAESFLDYVELRARQPADPRWAGFAAQLMYLCFDRSPAMSFAEQARAGRFGSRFDARRGDATEMGDLITSESMTGVILSNEMPDNFAVHKVRLSAQGVAEAAFVLPSLSRKTWTHMRASVAPSIRFLVERDSREIASAIVETDRGRAVYLSRDSFPTLLKSLVTSRGYAAVVRDVDVHEVYEPVGVVPELASYFQKNAQPYARALARQGKGMITYVNLGEEEFVRGAAQALKAGYVMTIDYGGTWDRIMKTGARPHLRTYGPATVATESAGRLQEGGEFLAAPTNDWRANSQPYLWPTLNDITSDVNFSHMAAEGQRAGLHVAYFGPQRALLHGTSISLNDGSARRRTQPVEEFRYWADLFLTDRDFKVLVEQKDGTDPEYRYPPGDGEPLDIDGGAIAPSERQRVGRIADRLASGR